VGESEAGIMTKMQLQFPAARHWPKQSQHDHVDHLEGLTPKQKKFFRRRFCCIDCGKCTHCGGEYYMVRDELWSAAGVEPNGGMLCLHDLERRIGRALTTDDFTAKMPSFSRTRGSVLLPRVISSAELRE
jgi:hypothetical protein